MKFITVSIFPEFFDQALGFSLLGRAQRNGVILVENYNLRDWAKPKDVHKQIDDRPFGGGPGMVMKVEPVYRAIKELRTKNPSSYVIIFSPKGMLYDQVLAENFASEGKTLILICPHYEGFDERILEFVDYEICIGDYVLTGGEIPALIVIDSVSRLIDGVLGNAQSKKTESFSQLKYGKRNLEYPQYTRPAVFIDDEGKEYKVPDILLGGNHKAIDDWRKQNSR